MEVRALKTIRGEYGLLRRGKTGAIDDTIAKKLIAAGYVEEVKAKAEPKPKADDSADAEKPADEKPKRKPKGKSDADTDD